MYQSSTIDHRIDHFGRTLRRQLKRLYGDVHDVDDLWERVEEILRARHEDRSAALRDLDATRAADPNWFVAPEMLGYSTYIDRFASTVPGLEQHVDHLEALGVRYLHLLALLKARKGDSDGGFAVADYLSIEPALGTMADVERLAAQLRKSRISLCVDLALNHTSDDHHWALAAKAGDPLFRDFYIVVDEETARLREKDLSQVFPGTAPGNFTHVPEMGGWVWTTFYPFQWDLNWANPKVLLAILDAMLRLANHGFEAFRFDSIAFLWKEAGTDSRNRPAAHHIVRALRAALDIAAPATLIKAEAIVPTAYVPPYFGADEGEGFEAECHLVYNNSLMVAGWVALSEGDAALPEAIIQASGGLPPGANWLSYVRCHDDIGWSSVLNDLASFDPKPIERLTQAARFTEGRQGSWACGEAFQSDGASVHGTNGTLASLAGLERATDEQSRDAALRRIRLLNALSIASGGLATLFMGDEAGLLNDHSYLNDPQRRHEGRWVHRPDMDWEALDKPTARRIISDINALRDARIASGGAGGPEAFDTGHPALLGVRCGSDLVFLNFSATPISVVLPTDCSDRLIGRPIDRQAILKPWDVLWAGVSE
ncbi:amylosucrase [Sphingobium lactosutens]|uniref:alpha-amylase family glycosyl hydrolase n=1 Tax=Sphingobium lactosutens TaxID=522773 RepID=UPI0015B8709C|nr:alpha-amylase family glycosyl hydrolase [Sphingobium lactosutens]NWK98405.1 amylosucrase [Sphingobium lactosutens]